MAFNDFCMILTVVVFCTFSLSVLHYRVAAFVSALINLCYHILNIRLYYIIKTQQARKSIVLKLCGYATAFRPDVWGVWSHNWGGGGVGGCRNITVFRHWISQKRQEPVASTASCCRTWIGSHVRSIEWWHVQWGWRTPNRDFMAAAFLKSDISKTTRDRAIYLVLGTKLLENTKLNRKS